MHVPAVLLFALLAAGLVPSAEQRLPDADTFFAETRKRLESNPQLRARYAYRERRTEMHLNPFGRLGPGPVHVYEVFPGPTPALTYRRLVERAGAPLSSRELADQDREHLTKIEAHRKEREAESAADRARREARERARTAEAREQADEVLALFDFGMIGRARLDGHPAILVRFTPRADARPRSREAKVAAAFEGRAWVHEHQFEVMRIEASAVEDVSFGFGIIARLHRGATAMLVRRPFIGGGWLPSESRFEGTGRALLLRHMTVQYVYEYSDYRPFNPDGLAAMLGGADRSVGPPR